MAGIGDFNQLISSDPEFASKWGEVQTQLQAEGMPDLTGAKIAFSDSFQQLASQSFGLLPPDALNSAKEYVLAGQSVLGAIHTVQNIIAADGSLPPAQAVNAFTGTLIGLAAGAGLVSAGVGAAIVAAVGAATEIAQSLGLFGGTAHGATFAGCGDIHFDPAPDWLVGCVGFKGPTTTPNSANWRRFPNPNAGADSPWFTNLGSNLQDSQQATDLGEWMGHGVHLWTGHIQNKTLIYVAFPEYADIESWQMDSGHWEGNKFISAKPAKRTQKLEIPYKTSNSAIDFTNAYINAWKANKEYALNGLKFQSDADVLLHLVRMWNRSHVGASHVLIAPKENGNYWEKLVYAIMNSYATDPVIVQGQLAINTGGLKNPTVAPTVKTVPSPVAKPAPTLIQVAVNTDPCGTAKTLRALGHETQAAQWDAQCKVKQQKSGSGALPWVLGGGLIAGYLLLRKNR